MATLADRVEGLEEKRFIMYHPQITKFLGDINSSIFISYIAFWQGKGSDGNWVYKSRKNIYNETGLTKAQIRRVEKILIDFGYIKYKDEYVNDYAKVRHYQIIWKKFNEDFDDLAERQVRRTTTQEQLAHKKHEMGIL